MEPNDSEAKQCGPAETLSERVKEKKVKAREKEKERRIEWREGEEVEGSSTTRTQIETFSPGASHQKTWLNLQ